MKTTICIFLLSLSMSILFAQSTDTHNRKYYESDYRAGIVMPKRDSLQLKGEFDKSLSGILQILDTAKFISIYDIYNIAVNYSKLGQIDSAFTYLYRYIKVSRDDRIIIFDQAFDTLRQFAQWDSIVKRIEYYYTSILPPTTNKELALQLFYLGIEDQKYRVCLPSLSQGFIESDSSEIFFILKYIIQDKINTIALEEIIKKYGFPSISLVGKLASSNAFLVLQHSGKIRKYYKLVKQLCEKRNFNSSNFAYLTDRHLMIKNKKQIYGTQFFFSDKTEKKYPGKVILYPTKDFKNINERRKEIGLIGTVEEYLEMAGDTNIIIPKEYYEE